jgi:hypothetical protein
MKPFDIRNVSRSAGIASEFETVNAFALRRPFVPWQFRQVHAAIERDIKDAMHGRIIATAFGPAIILSQWAPLSP